MRKSLFRQEAVEAASSQRLPDEIVAARPVGLHRIAFIATSLVLLAGSLATIVQVPGYLNATGVVQPAGGFVQVKAPFAGWVELAPTVLSATPIVEGQLLATLTDTTVLKDGATAKQSREQLQARQQEQLRLSAKSQEDVILADILRMRQAVTGAQQEQQALALSIEQAQKLVLLAKNQSNRLAELQGVGMTTKPALEQAQQLEAERTLELYQLRQSAARLARDMQDTQASIASQEAKLKVTRADMRTKEAQLQVETLQTALQNQHVLRAPSAGAFIPEQRQSWQVDQGALIGHFAPAGPAEVVVRLPAHLAVKVKPGASVVVLYSNATLVDQRFGNGTVTSISDLLVPDQLGSKEPPRHVVVVRLSEDSAKAFPAGTSVDVKLKAKEASLARWVLGTEKL